MISKVAVAICCVNGSVSMLALNQAPLRLDWKATRSIEPATRGVGEGVVVVGLGEGVEVGVGVKLEVGVGDGGAAVPQALNIKAAAAKRIALAIVLVFIPFSFIVCEHCHRMGWLCEGRCISEAHRPVRGYHPRELPKR